MIFIDFNKIMEDFIKTQREYFKNLNLFTRNTIAVWTSPKAKTYFTDEDTKCVNFAISNAPKIPIDIILYKAIYEDFRNITYHYPYSTAFDLKDTFPFLFANSNLESMTEKEIKNRIKKKGYINTILKINIKAGTPVLIVDEYSGLSEFLLLSPEKDEFNIYDKYIIDIGKYPVKFFDLDYTFNNRVFIDNSLSDDELFNKLIFFNHKDSTFIDLSFEGAVSATQMTGICNVSSAIYDKNLRRIVVTEDDTRIQLYGTTFGINSSDDYKSRIYSVDISLIDKPKIDDIILSKNLSLGLETSIRTSKYYDITEDDIELICSFKPFNMENYVSLMERQEIISFSGKWMQHDLLYFLYSTFYDPLYLLKLKEYTFMIKDKEYKIKCNIPYIKGIYCASILCDDIKIENCPYFNLDLNFENNTFKTIKFDIEYNYTKNLGIQCCFKDTLNGCEYIVKLLQEYDINIEMY